MIRRITEKPSSEKVLERRLLREVKKRGGYCIKLLPWLETGLPDREVILPGGLHLYVELKSTGKIMTPKQLVWRNRLVALGHEHWVIDGEKAYNCLVKRMDYLTQNLNL